MTPDLQRRVQRYGWDKAASQYESYWQQQLKPAQDRVLQMADLQPGERVLDIACGTGLVSFRAASAVGSDGEVIGVDLSDEMVTLARRISQDRSVDHATFEQMDAEALQLPDHAFDSVLCSLGLMYVPHPTDAVDEMRRVLGPRGRAVAAVWGRRDCCGWAEVFPIVDRRVTSDVCPLFFQLGTGDALAHVMRTAGFVDVATERFSTTLHYETPEEVCAAAFEAGPVALAYRRFDDATKEGAHEEYLDSVEPFRTNGVYEIPGEFVVTKGINPA